MAQDEPLKYTEKIRVLIVDDSAVMRRIIMSSLLAHPEIEVIGTSENGLEAIADIKRIKPDLVTLDIEMPEMDGLTALKQIRLFDRHLPIIMFSSLTQRGAEATIDALTLGASDYVGKPTNLGDRAEALRVLEEILVPKIKDLCQKTKRSPLPHIKPQKETINLSSVLANSSLSNLREKRLNDRIEAICIGVSTGGPAALMELFKLWKSPLSVPIFIVQHMPPKFTEYLATRINAIGVIPTTEAINGQEALPGHAYIAPGGMHMEVVRSGSKTHIALNENPPENSCRPAVDVLFRSAANVFGSRVLGVVLTGMGYDGLKGSMEIVKAGGRIWAQDQESSVIWGMPGAVVNENLTEKVLPLTQIPNEILLQLQRK